MSNMDLDSVINDSIQDALVPDAAPAPTDDTADLSLDTGTEAPVEALGGAQGDDPAAVTPSPTDTSVASPGARQAQPVAPADPFEKKIGIPAQTNGRENRIPYSRVKKIVEKAEREASAPLTAKVAELEPKVADYEARLTQVAQFEQIMVNDPQKFLGMLSQIPAYAGFFQTIAQLSQAGARAPQQAPPDPNEGMPQPDIEMQDGSKAYSLEGLQKLNEWRDARVLAQAEDRIAKRYAPIEQEWKAHQQIQQLVPQVQSQIERASQWPLFKESEQEIIAFLSQNQKAGLEEAYMAVVVPKLVTDRNAMRQSILAEVGKAKPVVSAPTSQSKTAPATGPRSLEQVIADSIKSSGTSV